MDNNEEEVEDKEEKRKRRRKGKGDGLRKNGEEIILWCVRIVRTMMII